MFLLDTNNRDYGTFSLNISCADAGLSFWGMTRDITNTDLYLEVPTTRIKTTLSNFLNKDVTMKFENVLIQGTIRSYTIEGDYYRIGISISKSHRSAWRGFLAEKSRLSLQTEVRHAAS